MLDNVTESVLNFLNVIKVLRLVLILRSYELKYSRVKCHSLCLQLAFTPFRQMSICGHITETARNKANGQNVNR